MKFDGYKIMKVLATVCAVGGTVLSFVIDGTDREKMKSEIIDELKKKES